MRVKVWICSLLLVVAAVAPVLAGTNDTADSKAPAETATAPAAASPNGAPAAGNGNVTALLGVLVMKGVLAPSEANAIRNAAPEAEFQMLVDLLARKGVVSASELSAAGAPSAPSNPPAATPQPAVALVSTPPAQAAAQAPAPKETKPPAPAVVPAIAPLRVLPVDPPVKDGLKAAFTLGPVKMTPYGFLKATGVYDTSNPNGDDMPFPGLFLNTPQVTSTGPTTDPNFHLKARSSRIGANFEFADLSPKITLTGRIEGDFEGNFSEVDNRDVSSIRSSMFSSARRGCVWTTPPATKPISTSKADRTGPCSDRARFPIFWKPRPWAIGMATSTSVLRNSSSGSYKSWVVPPISKFRPLSRS